MTPGREDDDAGHDEILALLPWYANRTLDADEAASVSRHLESCEACRRELDALTALNETVRADADGAYRTFADADAALANVMARVDAETGTVPAKAPWSARWRDAFERLPPRSTVTPGVRWSATALAGLLVAVLGLRLYDGGPTDEYSVLSSPDSDRATTRLSVELASPSEGDRAESAVASVLDGLERRAVVRTDADGAYVVEFEGELGVDELNEIVLELENDAGIDRVELLPR